MGRVRATVRRWAGQGGSSLVEVVLAVALLGSVAVAALGAVSTGALAANQVRSHVGGFGLARTQLEYTKSYEPYQVAPTTYPTVTPPQGYSLTAEAVSIPDRDDDIQKIIVTVWREGKVEVVVEGYKSNR